MGRKLSTLCLDLGWRAMVLVCLFTWGTAPRAQAQGEQFTMQLGTVPVSLVNHADVWNYHKGTNAPQADWTFAEDGDLNFEFQSQGPGGIGFGDNDDTTLLLDMQGRYVTVYTRKSIAAPAAVNPAHHLKLLMDYDDGFVAYLDGLEVARSANAGPVGTVHPFNVGTTSDHPAVSEGGSVETFDLGPVGSRLGAGNHVLAIQGINGDIGSSDLTLIADLKLEDPAGSGTVVTTPLFALTQTPTVTLSGVNTYLEAEDVLVNGEPATYDGLAGTWTKAQTLVPGMNRLVAVTRNPQGRVLATLTQDLIYEATSTTVGGTLASSTTWSPAMGIVRVTSNITIPAGMTLKVDPGTVILLSPNVMIMAQANGLIQIEGSEAKKAFFLPADGTTGWAEMTAQGNGSNISVRHGDVAGGRIRALSGAVGLIEDSHVHHSTASSIINSLDAQSFTVRRSHVEWYQEMLYQRTLMLIEDSLFENPASDAVDFDGAPPGSTIRQCTFRHGPTGSNTDAVDLGPLGVPVSVLVEDCIMHDFSDKGVSIGEIGTANSAGIVIRNCLIFDVVRGVQVKDTTVATIHDCTIVDCQIGVHGFFKQAANPGGGILTNFNNILYGDTSAVVTNNPPNGTIITVDHCDTFGVNWPGAGNINAEPLFRNPAERDYRLLPGSPCLGAGRNGEDMGVRYPVGGMPDLPGNLQATPGASSDEVHLTWIDSSAKESGFIVQVSTDGTTWSDVATAPKNATAATVTGLAPGPSYVFRVQAINFISRSLSSNIASVTSNPGDTDGDGMPDNWESDHGLNPNDPADASGDLDMDGFKNRDEYLAGTDPEDPQSNLGFSSITLTESGLVQLHFRALANRTYQVLWDDSVDGGSWEVLRTVPAELLDRNVTVDDVVPAGEAKRFYRLTTP